MSKRVLVIEDNELNMKLIRLILTRDGFTVIGAANGHEGILLAKDNQPDLILLDIQLPGVDGITVARQLKAGPLTSAIPIVALTAYAMKGDEECFRSEGCDGYLAKPFRLEQFREAVRSLL